jgi:histidinol dehydrogenase
MRILQKPDNDFFAKIDFDSLPSVEKIILDVKKNGDCALIGYCEKFNDGNFSSSDDFLVSENEIQLAINSIDKNILKALESSINNVKEFAKKQLECIKNLDMKVEGHPDSVLGHRIIPLKRVLCYVPGGNYPLLSSAVMGCVPALVAGVEEIYVTSPRIAPETIVAAHLSGASKIYKLGGAQAISAFAYGTQSIKNVDKIVGPGNKYVTYAKKYVFGECGIDFLAGPSEVLIVADDSANPEIIAADMLAQCEHDIKARAYLISLDEKLPPLVEKAALEQLKKLSTREIAESAFKNSIAIIVNSIEEAIEISDKRAPEHLELMLKNPQNEAQRFKNYGSLFIGSNCAEVFGDYCSGTNHILPTNQVARYHGGLSVFDFVKIQTYQNIDKNYANILCKTASILAEAEGLQAHKFASDLRGEE